jgi:hypothetical protein
MKDIIAALGAPKTEAPYSWTFDPDEKFSRLRLMAKSTRDFSFGPGPLPGKTPVTVILPAGTEVVQGVVTGVAMTFGTFQQAAAGEAGGLLFHVDVGPINAGQCSLDVWAYLKNGGTPVDWTGTIRVELMCFAP